MVRVLVVVLVGHEPFIDSKDATGLENAKNFRVNGREGWRMDCGFDCVDGVKRVVRKGHLLVLQLVTSGIR